MKRINASNAYIVKHCPGSLEFEAKRYPLEKQSEEAKKGEEEHKKLTDELQAGKIPDRISHYLPEKPRLFIEKAYEDTFLGVTLYARPDVAAVKGDTLYILDFKTGFADVSEMDPLQNIQAAFLFMKEPQKYVPPRFKKIICRYIGTETRLSTFETYTISDIHETMTNFVEDVKKGLKAKKPQLNTGAHCRYCKHRNHCPKLKSVIKEFENPKLRGKPVEELPADLIRILPVADKIIDSFRKDLKARLEDGVLSDIAGVSLKYQNAPRSWDSSIDAESLASITKKPVEMFLDSKLKTVASLLNEYPELEDVISNYVVQGKQARLVISVD